MNWLEITLNTVPERLDELTDVLTALGVEGIVTEDESVYQDFLENNKKYWDYVDASVMAAVHNVSRLKFYLEDSGEGEGELARLRDALPGETLLVKKVKDEDWENNWKQYYNPIPIGQRLMIVPEWQDAPEHEGREVLRLDPGLIFGTGSHPTTQMCLEALETLPIEGCEVLDLGCGSGILAIAALLLGADRAVGVDIDEKAPSVVMENAALNGIGADRLTVFAGDVLSDSDTARRLRGRKFRVVLANIVADVIIALSPKALEFAEDGGYFMCSGVIEGREDEVEAALKAAGFHIIRRFNKDGWFAFLSDRAR